MKTVRQLLVITLFAFYLSSCGTENALQQEYLEEGIWRGVIKTQGQELPFNFEVEREDSVTYHLYIINGAERIEIRGLAMQGDSVFIPIHLFDSGIKAKLINRKMVGIFAKNYDESSALPFEADFNQNYRFPKLKKSSRFNVAGKWEVRFKNENEEHEAVGVFTQNKNQVEGTFLTKEGDLRYLEGVVEGDELLLSTFDGENAFLFKANIINENELQGHFWSGAFQYKSWKAVKNENVVAPFVPQESILKEGVSKINFRLTDLNGKIASLSDEKYQDKIKVVQIFGTWSPNSLDEIRFLTDWKKMNKGIDIAIIGLSFEVKDDFTYAKKKIHRMTKKLNADYDFLFAGKADTSTILEKLPALKDIAAFPTTLILDKKNNVRYVNTGFRGPASGEYYEEYKIKFNKMIHSLLIEGSREQSLVIN